MSYKWIYAEDDLPADQKQFIEINAQAKNMASFNSQRKTLPLMQEWENKPDKIQYLETWLI